MNSVSPENHTKQTDEIFGITDVVNILGNEFSNIYVVDCESQSIEIYRYENENVGVKESLHKKHPYKSAIQTYIDENVFSEDKNKMQAIMEFAKVYNQLQQVPQFTVHYRVKREGIISYYYMKCARIGDADTFKRIVFAFANEDSDVKRAALETIVQTNLINGKRKILIIEDNKLNQEMLSSILEDRYEIITAENGEIGLEILEKNYRELSVILLDVQMPVCNGFEFLKRVQEDIMLSSVPVIVITANDEVDTELRCLEMGASDFIRKPYSVDIVRGRIGNIIKLKESTVALAAVERDELTGLYTEQAFLHYAKTIMKFKSDGSMHLIVAKIRDFKLINNIYGSKKADEVLCYLAAAYDDRIKSGLIARKGTSSFICLLWGEQEKFWLKLEETIRKIASDAPINGLKVKYGVYKNIDRSLSFSTICDYASMAEESITDSYDYDVAYYTEKMAQKRIYSQMIENCFEDALNNQEFVVYYQPKIDIITEKVVGAEALVRWKKDGTSMISPGDFIPVYEKDGLIVRLDEYVFRQVCQMQKRKITEGKKVFPVSVNLSRSSALHRDVAERYIGIVKELDIPFSCVPIELTESAAVYNDRLKTTMEQLTAAGFVLHIDDFGAGYSSLISLNQFPFSTLKIDKSLIDQIDQKNGRTLVEQVITISKLLDMKVVAEGVENREQLDILRKLDCDEVQGFYYARPMPEEEFAEYMKNSGFAAGK